MLCLLFYIQLLSKVKFNRRKPEESLNLLVEDFENNSYTIESIPRDFSNYFSIPGLVNSLNVQLPLPPKYNLSFVEKSMKGKAFSNTDDLANYILTTFSYQVDRLFAIFYYEANNFLYDYDSLFANSIKYKTIEEIFESKLCVCGHFAYFMDEMAKKCKISEFEFSQYLNYAKGMGKNLINAPKKFEANHAAILIKYNNSYFISEPTWAASSALKDYDPFYFLIPIERTLSYYYPDPGQVNLSFPFTYEQFKKLISTKMNEKDTRLESHIFWNYETRVNYMSFKFSFSPNVTKLTCFLSIVDDNKTYFNNVRIECISGKRKQFIVYVNFPKKGFYELSIWIDDFYVLSYFIRNKGSPKNFPILSSPMNDYKFTPIEPKVYQTNVNSNYFLFKFISKKNSYHKFLFKKNKTWYYTGFPEEHLVVPGNDEISEKLILISFENPGKNKIKLLINNDKDITNDPYSISYIFNVKIPRSHSSIPSIKSLIPENREILSQEHQLDTLKSDTNFEGIYNVSTIVPKIGQNILTSIDYKKGEKKILELMNNIKKIGKNSYGKFDHNKTKKKITDLSNQMILLSKEMYDNFDIENTKDMINERTTKLISQIQDLLNNFDSGDIQKKILEITENLATYFKQIINSSQFQKAKETIKEKGKQIYNDFDFNNAKQKVSDTVKQKYNQVNKFVKKFISNNENESLDANL